MRRDTLLAWVIGIFALIAACLALTGCAVAGWPTVEPSSEQEHAVVAETALAAARQGVKVVGAITEKCDAGDDRAGWYANGTAFYYRPIINQYPVERMRELAVHEVCHASSSFAHDTAHWCCMKREGEIGYPPPVTPGGAWPECGGAK